MPVGFPRGSFLLLLFVLSRCFRGVSPACFPAGPLLPVHQEVQEQMEAFSSELELCPTGRWWIFIPGLIEPFIAAKARLSGVCLSARAERLGALLVYRVLRASAMLGKK